MAMPNKEPILFGEGWEVIEQGIVKMRRILEGLPKPPFTSEEYITIYTTIHNMCVQKVPHDQSALLYKKYREVIEVYITSVVLPSLKDKHDEFLLRELAKRWLNHKVMTRWFLHFFVYLNRYFVKRELLPSLDEVAVACFRDLVYQETKGEVKDAVICLIDRERQGEQIDRALLKNVIDIFVEIGTGQGVLEGDE